MTLDLPIFGLETITPLCYLPTRFSAAKLLHTR